MSRRTMLGRFGSSYQAVCLAVALQAALALPASAATLVAASVSFAIGSLPGAFFPGVGATGTATSNLSASLGAGTAFNGAYTTTVPTSAAPPLTAVQVILTKNAGNAFTGTAPSKVGGSLAIEGSANVYGIGGFPGGGAPLLAVPLKLGMASTIAKAQGGVAITVISAAWTAGSAVVTGLGDSGTETATAAGANALTAGGAGTLVLVTPVKIITGVAGTLSAFGVLSLTYVPEPGALLLVGLGVAGLAALGRGRAAPRVEIGDARDGEVVR